MQGDGDLRILDNGGLDQLYQIGVIGISARSLGHLQDHGAFQFARGLGDALNDLHIIDVECADRVSAVISFPEHFFRCYQRHFSILPFSFFMQYAFLVKIAYLQINNLIISSNKVIIKKYIS